MINRLNYKKIKLLHGERRDILDDKIKKLCASRDIMKKHCPELEAVKELRIKLSEAKRQIRLLQTENVDLKTTIERNFGGCK